MRGWRQAPAGEPGERDQHLPKKQPSQHQEAPEAPDERGWAHRRGRRRLRLRSGRSPRVSFRDTKSGNQNT